MALTIGLAIGRMCRSAAASAAAEAISVKRHFGATSAVKSAKTCLYDFHVANGGKMVDFAGYSMPVEYSSLGIIQSHLHTRTHCSIFDVSHMLQSVVYGKDRFEFIESLTVADIRGLDPNTGTLTLFTNSNGGIEDDLIVTSTPDYLYVVSNAGCRENDTKIMTAKIDEMRASGKDVSLQFLNDRGLVALQGPTMKDALQPLTDIDLSKLGFMNSIVGKVAGIDNCRITRCGYTGEDGVEISVDDHKTQELVESLLSSKGSPALAGLGARDSLRLEAGLCLYGNDIDKNTTPIEATLAWTIPKSRRTTGGFPGDKIILDQLKNKTSTVKRVGFLSKGAPIRGHAVIVDTNGNKIGTTTSGCPSPSLKGNNISMGYVNKKFGKVGTEVKIIVRNKPIAATVAKMPFVATNYYHL